MQPDITRIEESLIAIYENTRKIFALTNREEAYHTLALLDVYHPARQKEATIVVSSSPAEPPSAHATLASKPVKDEIIREGQSILSEMMKSPALDYEALKLQIGVKKPDHGGDCKVELIVDCFRLGRDGAPIDDICKNLARIFAQYAEIPEEALQGPMRAFTCNEGEIHHAPSPEAMIFKRYVHGWKTTGIKEHIDSLQALKNLQRMIEERKAAS